MDVGHLDLHEIVDWLEEAAEHAAHGRLPAFEAERAPIGQMLAVLDHGLTGTPLRREIGEPPGRLVPRQDTVPLTFYVCAPSSMIARVERLVWTLEELGGRCAYDWTKPVREHGANGPQLADEAKREFALRDMNAARSARLVVGLTDRPGARLATSTGAAFELGLAFARSDGCVVMTAGGQRMHPIFGTIVDETPIVMDDEDAADVALVRRIVAWWADAVPF